MYAHAWMAHAPERFTQEAGEQLCLVCWGEQLSKGRAYTEIEQHLAGFNQTLTVLGETPARVESSNRRLRSRNRPPERNPRCVSPCTAPVRGSPAPLQQIGLSLRPRWFHRTWIWRTHADPRCRLFRIAGQVATPTASGGAFFE